jgi:DNA gyrase subunit B
MKNPKVLTKCIGIVKLNAKARLQMDKAKKSVVKNETGALSDHKIKKLLPCNNRGKQYKEIFIVEGGSANGSFEKMRDDNTQAAFSMRGVPLNTGWVSLNKMLLNDEIKELVLSLKTNIGTAFDISKLYYNKIIIMTDSDIDGNRICSLLCLFFVYHMPEIIEQGYLYRALPPLYVVTVDGKRIFVRSKAEFIELTEKKVRTVMDVSLNGKKLTSKELNELMMMNRQYDEEINRIAEKLPLHPEIVEFIARYHEYVNFGSLLKERFPEIEYDGESLEGVYDKAYQTAIIDKVLIAQLRTIERSIHEINHDTIDYSVTDKKTGETRDVTLYQFFTMIDKYRPKIDKRFKGLGELEAEDLWETTLNPENRTLLRFTMEDALAVADQFKVLHGPNATAEREKLMNHFKIIKDDLDN